MVYHAPESTLAQITGDAPVTGNAVTQKREGHMEVLVDGKALSGEFIGENLLELLQVISDTYLGDDLAIRELLINGDPYEENVHGAPENVTLGGIRRLEIETISSRELALGFLESYQPVLDTLAQATEKVAELFRVGDEQQANEEYLQFLEALELLLESMQRVSNALNLDMANVTHQDVSARDRLDRLSELTGEMLAAQEEDDWILLADLLQYDLKPEFEAWSQLMDQMRRMTMAS